MAYKAKYSLAIAKVICEGLAKGLSRELAAARAGVTRKSIWEWTKSKPEFAEMVENSEAVAAAHWLDQIESAAAEGNWQAAAWKLERRYPDLYGRPGTLKHEVSGPNGGSIPVEFIASAAFAAVTAGSATDRPDTK